MSADHAVRDTPQTRYAYDPHLSPQLVWAGKPGLRSIGVEEQAGVEVDDVALHIHERVSSEYGRPAFSRINGITLAADG